MDAAIGWVGVIAFFAVCIWISNRYQRALRKGIERRIFTTALPSVEVRRIFESTVACKGWHLVDEGPRMVAQSPLATGIRQQVALEVTEAGGTRRGAIYPVRVATKSGGLSKAHTIRLRMESFSRALISADSHANIAKG